VARDPTSRRLSLLSAVYLRLLAGKRRSAQIGGQLYSPETVGVHVSSILRKMGYPAWCRPPRWPGGPPLLNPGPP
jgi:hypothetical protein